MQDNIGDFQADSGGTQLDFLNGDARAGATIGGKPSLTIDQAANTLVRGRPGWSVALHTPFTVTYAFRADAPATMPRDATGFQRFNAQEINQAELAMRSWADVANITFVRVGSGTSGDGAYSNDATILLGAYTGGVSGAAAFSSYPGNTASTSSAGDLWLNASFSYDANPTPTNYGGMVLVHELGHTIGLAHPSDYNATSDTTAPTYAADADYYEDSQQYTVMSYFEAPVTGGDFR